MQTTRSCCPSCLHFDAKELWRIDFLSALTSAVGLFGLFLSLVIPYFSSDWAHPGKSELWTTTMIFSTDSALENSASGLKSQLFQSCSSDPSQTSGLGGDYNMFSIRETWTRNKKVYTYTGNRVAIDRGNTFMPFWMLFWIMLCSIFFQGYRSMMYKCITPTVTSHTEPDTIDKNLNLHSGFGAYDYVPSSGPDFWRWLEYALTSPLQIIIIAASFYVRDEHTLLALGCVQGALVLLGYTLETQIETIYTYKDEERTDLSWTPQKKSVHVAKMMLLLTSVYLFHAVVWYIVFENYISLQKATVDCDNPISMPGAIIYLVIAECVLFTLFGLVQTVQIICALCAQEFSPQTTRDTWTTVSAWYSILSVVAKLILEFLFLNLINFESQRQNNQISSLTGRSS